MQMSVVEQIVLSYGLCSTAQKEQTRVSNLPKQQNKFPPPKRLSHPTITGTPLQTKVQTNWGRFVPNDCLAKRFYLGFPFCCPCSLNLILHYGRIRSQYNPNITPTYPQYTRNIISNLNFHCRSELEPACGRSPHTYLRGCQAL